MAVPVKVHKEYDELVDLLLSRGMDVPDREHAIKKISQVGYYRLSGFWYPCRIPHITTDNNDRDNIKRRFLIMIISPKNCVVINYHHCKRM
jgi:abortive infection bacteriophage resistance protein